MGAIRSLVVGFFSIAFIKHFQEIMHVASIFLLGIKLKRFLMKFLPIKIIIWFAQIALKLWHLADVHLAENMGTKSMKLWQYSDLTNNVNMASLLAMADMLYCYTVKMKDGFWYQPLTLVYPYFLISVTSESLRILTISLLLVDLLARSATTGAPLKQKDCDAHDNKHDKPA